jgi:hypothetical protein
MGTYTKLPVVALRVRVPREFHRLISTGSAFRSERIERKAESWRSALDTT